MRLYRFALLTVPARRDSDVLAPGCPSTLSGACLRRLRPLDRAPLAKQLSSAAAYPTPGSPPTTRCRSGQGPVLRNRRGDISEQQFGASFHGNDVQLRNLIATLQASRTARSPDCAATSRGQRRGDERGVDRRDAPDRSSFSGSAHTRRSSSSPPTDRASARWASSTSSATTATQAARCGDRPEPAGVQHPLAPLVIPWSTGRRAQQPARRNGELDRLAGGAPRPATRPISDLFSWRCPRGSGAGPLVERSRIRLSSDGELRSTLADTQQLQHDTFAASVAPPSR